MRTVIRVFVFVVMLSLPCRSVAGRDPSAFGDTWQLNLGPGVITGMGPTTIGAGFSLFTSFTPQSSWTFGFDTGMYIRTDPVSALVPLLPFVQYRERNPTVSPYLGVSLGPTFFLADPLSMQGTLFIKPGLEFRMSGGIDFFIEPRLGLIGSQFSFYPQFGVIVMYQ